MTLTREQMLPCPFCGFNPDVSDPDAVYPITRDKTVWGAHCYEAGGGCGAETLGDSADDAIAKWNRRDPALRALEQTNAAGQGITPHVSGGSEADETSVPAAPHSEPQATDAATLSTSGKAVHSVPQPARSEPRKSARDVADDYATPICFESPPTQEPDTADHGRVNPVRSPQAGTTPALGGDLDALVARLRAMYHHERQRAEAAERELAEERARREMQFKAAELYKRERDDARGALVSMQAQVDAAQAKADALRQVRLANFINTANISAADAPHQVGEKLQAAIDAATKGGKWQPKTK